jgi:hypothetical protein
MENKERILRKIEGFDYLISSDGDVYSMKGKNHRLISKCTVRNHVSVQMYGENGQKEIRYVHRLMAEAFLPNPLGLRFVVHKNGDKFDNRVENLMWCAQKEYDKPIKGEVWKVFDQIPDLKISNKGRVKHKGFILNTREGSDGFMKVDIPFHGTRTVELMRNAVFPREDRKKKPHRRKLNDTQVGEIKRDYQKGRVTLQHLADKYGVRKTAIHQIITGKSFAHVAPLQGESMNIRRPDSPHEAMTLVEAKYPIEVKSNRAIEYIAYILANWQNATFVVENERFNKGFAYIYKK